MECGNNGLRRGRVRAMIPPAQITGASRAIFIIIAIYAAPLLAAFWPGAAAGEDIGDYVVCPACRTLNPPDSIYCIRCGVRLIPEKEEMPTALRVATFKVAPLGCYGFHQSGPGLACEGNTGRWDYGLSYQYFPVSVPDDLPFLWTTEDDIHRLILRSAYYVRARERVTPFVGIVLDGRYQHIASNNYGQHGIYEHEFTLAAQASAGINLIYAAIGSNVEFGLSLGPFTWWETGPHKGDQFWGLATSLRIINVTYLVPHVGVWGEIAAGSRMFRVADSGAVVAAGPAFGW